MSGIIGIVSSHNTVPGLLHSLRHMQHSPSVQGGHHDHGDCQEHWGLVVHGHQAHSQSTAHPTTPARLHRHRWTQTVAAALQPMALGDTPELAGLSGHFNPTGLCGHFNLTGLCGPVGLGHTGLSHGSGGANTIGPMQRSHAQPHLSHGPKANLNSPARVAVVVQGPLQASSALRQALAERGYRYTSPCDAELLAHLIDATCQHDPVQAVRRALGLLSGPVAVGVLFQDHPHHLIAAHAGVPLWLGFNPDSHWVSSDLASLREHTDHIVALKPGDVVDLQAREYGLTDSQA